MSAEAPVASHQSPATSAQSSITSTLPAADSAVAPALNSSFSRVLPTLQLAVDSTSLTEFKTCPRKYQLGIIEGWSPKFTSHHLIFGLLYHGALERYDHKRSQGEDHEPAVRFAVGWALSKTWNKGLSRPWISGDSSKNRLTLVRTIVDYLDLFGENDSLKTIQLASGKPAVELSFSFFSGYHSKVTGEPFLFCGHLDRLAEMDGKVYISDRKTTSHTISSQWFSQFTPHNQFSLYVLAGQVVWKQPVRGLVVDGAQVAVGFSRFERALIPRDEAQLKEWHRDTLQTLEQMEKCAEQNYWPQNDSACGNYGGCKFRSICAKTPGSRKQWLQAEFSQRIWDPLQRRGDI